MTRTVVVTKAADRDILIAAGAIAVDSPVAADRFLRATQQTISELAEFPERGRVYESSESSLIGTRWVPLNGFQNHLVFYQIQQDAILILRVLHGARDLDAL